MEKRFGVLFTRLTVRAIHVEIAHSLSTDPYIMAKRGAVTILWTDAINVVMDESTEEKDTTFFVFIGGSWER